MLISKEFAEVANNICPDLENVIELIDLLSNFFLQFPISFNALKSQSLIKLSSEPAAKVEKVPGKNLTQFTELLLPLKVQTQAFFSRISHSFTDVSPEPVANIFPF